MFITFEGGEGCGKSTQSKLLKEYFEDVANKKVTLTREPGGTPLAENLRNILLQDSEIKNPLTEYLILTAARNDHIEKMISPLLLKDEIVICDRFVDSTIVYQSFVKRLSIDKIISLNEIILGDFKPDVTFLLDIEPKISLQRINSLRENKNHYDVRNIDFHNKIRLGFLKLAKNNPKRIHVINANNSKANIHDNIVSIIETKLLRF